MFNMNKHPKCEKTDHGCPGFVRGYHNEPNMDPELDAQICADNERSHAKRTNQLNDVKQQASYLNGKLDTIAELNR